MSTPLGAEVPRALIEWDEHHNPYSPLFDDIYRPRGSEAARTQTQEVFLSGNGLPARWQGQSHFVILESGFGLGTNFLATWQAWQQDARRSARLTYIGLEGWLPEAADVVRAQRELPWAGLAATLSEQWPSPTRNIHLIDLDGGRVRLLLCLGDGRHTWPRLVAQVNAFYLDGFAPARNPDMWDARLLRHMARLAAPEATACTWSAARRVREGLTQAGFIVKTAPGPGSKRDITMARFAPVFQSTPPPGRRAQRLVTPVARDIAHGEELGTPDAIVLGAGLAGAAIAAALSRRGLSVQVLTRGESPADAASGNPAGLYHGTWHRSDGHHARLLRACALWAHRKYQSLVSAGHLRGQCEGLVRLGSPPQPQDRAPPPEYAQWLSAPEVSGWTHTAASEGGWRYVPGGWVDPREVVRHDLSQHAISVRTGALVSNLEREICDGVPLWLAKDDQGRVCGRAALLIVANGTGASELLMPWGWDAAMTESVRGQVTWLRNTTAVSHPMAGDGYALRLSGDLVMCGASSHTQDDDPCVRQADHDHNLTRLARLTGLRAHAHDVQGGRTAFRLNTWDKLPLVGPWPDVSLSQTHRTDQARMWPRWEGLYVMAGLGGRGLTWAPLLSELLSAWITAEPLPLESDLVDALDPARWRVKRARDGSTGKSHRTHA